MAEWSKALDSSSSLFGGVGSNPTWTTFFDIQPLTSKFQYFLYFLGGSTTFELRNPFLRVSVI